MLVNFLTACTWSQTWSCIFGQNLLPWISRSHSPPSLPHGGNASILWPSHDGLTEKQGTLTFFTASIFEVLNVLIQLIMSDEEHMYSYSRLL